MNGEQFIKWFENKKSYCGYCRMKGWVNYCPGCKYYRKNKRRGILDKFLPSKEYMDLCDRMIGGNRCLK